jgi:hypothetical protein
MMEFARGLGFDVLTTEGPGELRLVMQLQPATAAGPGDVSDAFR